MTIVKLQLQDKLKEAQELKVQQSMNTEIISKMKQEFIKLEIDKSSGLEQLQMKVEELKDSRSSLTQLYETQIELLKQRLEQKMPAKEVDYALSISQRDSLVKQLKKEISTLKGSKKKKEVPKKESDHSTQETIDADFESLLAKAQNFN